MISAIVITKNEEKFLAVCLQSLKWVDELIVYDNGSTDKTKQIAKQFTQKVFEYTGQDYAALRNLAFEKTQGDWVLYVDADERVLAPMRDEILRITKDDTCSAYAL
jgi:(heptosyl)LPS beta-1,4-glucosyltransferase